ncbi:NUDIX hydrolase [Pseudonocardia hydrocarbonoxydans]|uniref:NUDIX hydrolase n=1 Tax=Pseudonocardia hydrocarbonoxydans TaxID=76726 RepID=A0A4Y3WIG9_9PSEU|nr:NUDIX domain-containing protein [Pseudonocardia hydrocarbonoxydans]GEC18535.1 NUDIX hydrolase [Pseudonocardia hydrocarbonoxydans]
MSGHEVLAAVLRIGDSGDVEVLAWQRARDPDRGCWALPGGRLGDDEDVETSVLRQLAEKVDVREVAHVEQLGVFSEPGRVPGTRLIATAFLGLVPSDVDPAVPADTAWRTVSPPPAEGAPAPDVLPTPVRAPALACAAFDHGTIVAAARDRLRAKLSYTNLGFAIAPREFTISALRDLYVAALGHPVSATNLQRVLTRRALLEPTGAVAPPGPSGGRPAALFRFTDRTLRVTDAFAVLKPPGEHGRGPVP